MKTTTNMLSDFLKKLNTIYRIKRDQITYGELIGFLYKETPPSDHNFMKYDYAPYIESTIRFGNNKKKSAIFSVVVSTYNRCALLSKTINAIALQNNAQLDKMEFVIVDNGSKDATKETVISFVRRHKNLRAIYVKLKDNHGPPFARNAGTIFSRGNFIVFIDDDCLIPTNWLSEFKKELDADPEIAGVGGFKTPKPMKDNLDIYHRFLMWKLFSQPHIRTRNASISNLCGLVSNVCYRREVLEKIGGINLYFKHIGFPELKARIYKSGLKLLYEPRMVEHYAYFSLETHIKKLLPQGWDRYLLHILYPDIYPRPSLSHYFKRSAYDIRSIFSSKNPAPFFNKSFSDIMAFSFLSITTNFFLWLGKYWVIFYKTRQ